MSSDQWPIKYLLKELGREIIHGYPDGSFKPEGTITVEEFIKIAVTSIGFTDLEVDKEDWSKVYIDKALEVGLVEIGDFEDYKKNINRAEIVRIIVRCMEYNKETFNGRDKYIQAIKDYDTIGSEFNDYVLKAYSKGVVIGCSDGTFGADKNATRTEACIMISKMLHENARNFVEIPGKRMGVNDVILGADVYAEDPDEYHHAYFYTKVVNEREFRRDEFRSRITCTNFPEYNSFIRKSYVLREPRLIKRDDWKQGVGASFYIDRVNTGGDSNVPFIIEPGTKFEFIYTIEDLITGESKDYSLSLITK